MEQQSGACDAGRSSELLLCEADVLRTPEFEHPVQRAYGDGDLGRATPVGAGSYPPPVFHVPRTRNLTGSAHPRSPV